MIYLFIYLAIVALTYSTINTFREIKIKKEWTKFLELRIAFWNRLSKTQKTHFMTTASLYFDAPKDSPLNIDSLTEAEIDQAYRDWLDREYIIMELCDRFDLLMLVRRINAIRNATVRIYPETDFEI